jgi:NADPH-dependent ferric siderophore reductase
VTRTYTVRRVDRQAGEIAIDVVLHGDVGVAGPWAAQARPGDVIRFYGPGGAYSPSPDADWHLLAGDEAALPAIAAALEAMPAGVPVYAFIEVDSVAEEQVIDCPGELSLTWLHRNGAPAGDVSSIIDAVRGAPWPPGTPHVFVHGESGLIKGLRSYFRNERGVPGELLSLSGYWRTGLVEPDFQAWKAEQKNADVQAATR